MLSGVPWMVRVSPGLRVTLGKVMRVLVSPSRFVVGAYGWEGVVGDPVGR